jgi:hypothetical protein
MAVNVPDPNAFLQKLGRDVTNFRNDLQALMNDAAYLNSMGGSGFLQAPPFSMPAADADKIMATVGAVTATNPVVQNLQAWLASTQPLWGGQ